MNKLIIKLYLIIKLRNYKLLLYYTPIKIDLFSLRKKKWKIIFFYMNFHSILSLKLNY